MATRAASRRNGARSGLFVACGRVFPRPSDDDLFFAEIRAAHETEVTKTRTLLLIGHVPVPYSGNISPDGHSNHRGAWPADVYYADLDGEWTDLTVNTTSAERQANWNVPGDGRFDQSTIPSPTELWIGRIDLSQMTSFANKPNGRSELELMRQYFDKNHRFRTGQLNVSRRGLIADNFGRKGRDPIVGSAWRAFPPFFWVENVVEVGGDEARRVGRVSARHHCGNLSLELCKWRGKLLLRERGGDVG